MLILLWSLAALSLTLRRQKSLLEMLETPFSATVRSFKGSKGLVNKTGERGFGSRRSGLYLPSPLAVDLCPTVQTENVRDASADCQSQVSSQHTAPLASFTPAKPFQSGDYQVFDGTDHNHPMISWFPQGVRGLQHISTPDTIFLKTQISIVLTFFLKFSRNDCSSPGRFQLFSGHVGQRWSGDASDMGSRNNTRLD